MVGLIGTGRMGLPICARLVEAGHAVIASDRRPGCQDQARAVGADWADEPQAAARAADVLITVLPGPGEVAEAMELALPALRPGATWIDLTSSTPGVDRELGSRARELGVQCLDAPVGGGPGAARAGELQLFVGGPADVAARHGPLLAALGHVDHVGGHGAGHTTKLLVNLLWFGQAVATGEALLLARRQGLDIEMLRDVLSRSAAGTEFIRRDLDALLDGDYLESFGLDRCAEELRNVVGLATEADVPFALSTEVSAAYERALARYGPEDGELLAVALLEQQAGLRLRRPS